MSNTHPDPRIAACFERAPIVHNRFLVTELWKEMTLQGTLENRFKKPEKLTIVLCHNYPSKTLLEQNLDFLGIRDYVVLKGDPNKWSNLHKLKLIYDYLKSGRCSTDYLLYLDSIDVIIKRDPQVIVDVFEQSGCDLLFSTSQDSVSGYECMPKVKKWTDAIFEGLYLCAGVFIGRPQFMLEVFEEAMKYYVEEPLSRKEYIALGKGIPGDPRLCQALPEYPKGIGSDQHIFMYIHPKFYPKMKLDYRSQLCFRKIKNVSLLDRLEERPDL